MQYRTDDLRIKEIKELTPPSHVLREFGLTEKAAKTVSETRQEIHRVLHGADDRLVVIAGPCSIHDVKAAKEYAARLAGLRQKLGRDLLIVMRVYFEKPRTTRGSTAATVSTKGCALRGSSCSTSTSPACRSGASSST